ncbi:MAG TPA: 2'-5' RNA ligase family protein [Patescibacteria group bacterium]|nr:2'-5' RNA ligase family protein [Patescibacteria group bacterium]
MRYFVAITFPEGMSKEVDHLRRRFYPKSLKMHPPHITLFPPFSPVSEITDLSAPLRRASLEVSPFPLEMKEVGTFEGKRQHVLYLNVPVTKNLQNLFERIVAHLAPLAKKVNLPPTFKAHITVGNNLSLKAFEQARKELQSYEGVYSFKVEDIVLFEKEDKSVGWKEKIRVPLQGTRH